MIVGAGIADQGDRQIGIADAAVDGLVLFPEAALELQAHLHRCRVRHLADRGGHRVAGGDRNAAEHRQRNRADAPVGAGDAFFAAVRGILPGHTHAVGVLIDPGDLGVVGDGIAKLLRERLADLVHAAHRLEHGGLHLVVVAGRQRGPQTRAQHVLHAEGIGELRLARQAAAGIPRKAAPLAAVLAFDVAELVVERAPGPQGLQQYLLVFAAHALVQRLLLGALGQQLGHMALVIGIDGAKALRFAAKALLAVQQRVVVDLVECLQGHTELLAVTQHRLVVMRNAPRPRIEIQPVVKLAMLGRPAQFGVTVATTQRPVTPTGAVVVFQQLHAVPRLAQFEGRSHAGQPCPQNQHRGALRVAIQLQRPLEIGFGGHAQAAHRLVHHRATSGHADARQQLPPRHRPRMIALHQRVVLACHGTSATDKTHDAAGSDAGRITASERVGQTGEQLAGCDQLV